MIGFSLFGLSFQLNRSDKTRGKRSYAAAQNVARYSDFRGSRGSADYELRGGLSEVRAKIRKLARDSASIRRYINLIQTNVVGENGFILQSRVRRSDNTMNTPLNRTVEEAWNWWCKMCHVDVNMDMHHVTRQMVATWGRDGEVFIEIVYGPQYRDGIAINTIEADLLDETLTTINKDNGNQIRMGVEIDSLGRHIAYHFLLQHPGDATFSPTGYRTRHRRVPAERIIHLYERLRPGQTRGEPPACAAVNRIKMLDGYRESETMSRRVRAALMGFFTKDRPQAQGVAELATNYDDDDAERLEMELEPGVLKELPAGLHFQPFDPGGSTTDFAQFDQQVKKDVSMSLNLSAFTHGMETAGVSYSTGRTVVVEDRDYYKMLQRFFISGAMTRIFQLWLSVHITQDYSKIPPTMFDKILKSSVFRGRGWDWVDPAKEVRANREALASRQTSLARIAAARGIDRDDLLDEIEEDYLAAAERGIVLDYTLSGVTQETEQEDEED